MSPTAEELVRECTHPKVKGSRRELLNTIATLIPDGETVTAPIADRELATLIGYDERTVRIARKQLQAIRLVRVIGGGQGSVASYELLALPGAGAPPALPLRADLHAAPPVAPTPLFDARAEERVDEAPTSHAPTIRAYTVGSFFRSVVTQPRIFFPKLVTYFGKKIRSWQTVVKKPRIFFPKYAFNFGKKIRSWQTVVKKPRIFFPKYAFNFGKKIRSTHQVVDVDVARARDVRTHLQEVHTQAPPAPEPSPPRVVCRYAGTAHAWCDGRVHVPTLLHEELLRKHARLDGECDVDVEAKLFAFYAATVAAWPPSEPVGGDDFRFWRRAYSAAFSGRPPGDRRATPRGGRLPGASGCPHEPHCERTTDCIARVIAEGRGGGAKRRRH